MKKYTLIITFAILTLLLTACSSTMSRFSNESTILKELKREYNHEFVIIDDVGVNNHDDNPVFLVSPKNNEEIKFHATLTNYGYFDASHFVDEDYIEVAFIIKSPEIYKNHLNIDINSNENLVEYYKYVKENIHSNPGLTATFDKYIHTTDFTVKDVHPDNFGEKAKVLSLMLVDLSKTYPFTEHDNLEYDYQVRENYYVSIPYEFKGENYTPREISTGHIYNKKEEYSVEESIHSSLIRDWESNSKLLEMEKEENSETQNN